MPKEDVRLVEQRREHRHELREHVVERDQRLAYGAGAVEVEVHAFSGQTSATAATKSVRGKNIMSLAATTDLLILDYAVNDALWATPTNKDDADVLASSAAAAVRKSTAAFVSRFTAGAGVALAQRRRLARTAAAAAVVTWSRHRAAKVEAVLGTTPVPTPAPVAVDPAGKRR